MYSFTDKEINKLIAVTCNLSKGLDHLTYLRERGVESWDEKYNIFENYASAKDFISISEIDRMFKNVESIYSLAFSYEISQGLDNLAHIREKGIESWDEKYEISKNYNLAKKLLLPSNRFKINKMFRDVERVYKLVFKEKWEENLNEKTN